VTILNEFLTHGFVCLISAGTHNLINKRNFCTNGCEDIIQKSLLPVSYSITFAA
jgi:hypothetical protein